MKRCGLRLARLFTFLFNVRHFPRLLKVILVLETIILIITNIFDLQKRPYFQILILWFLYLGGSDNKWPKTISLLPFDHIIEASSTARITKRPHFGRKLILLLLILLLFLCTKFFNKRLVIFDLSFNSCALQTLRLKCFDHHKFLVVV